MKPYKNLLISTQSKHGFQPLNTTWNHFIKFKKESMPVAVQMAKQRSPNHSNEVKPFNKLPNSIICHNNWVQPQT